MGYIDKDALIAAYGEQVLKQLTDEDAQAVIKDTVLDPIIAHVDDIINGFCQAKYTVPFVTTPAIVKDIAQKLVFAELHDRGEGEIPDKVADDEKYVRRLLGQINTGTLKLEAPIGAAVDVSSMLSTKPRRFNKQTLEL